MPHEWQTSTERLEKLSFRVLNVKPVRGLGYLLFVQCTQPPRFCLCDLMVTAGKWCEGKSRWRVRPPPARQSLHLAPWGPRSIFPHNYNWCFGQECGRSFDCHQQNQGAMSSPWVEEEMFPRVFSSSSHVCSKGVELDVAIWQTMVSKLVGGEDLGKVPKFAPNWVPLSPPLHLEEGWYAVCGSDWGCHVLASNVP